MTKIIEVTSFTEIEAEFIRRVHTWVWCNLATLDSHNRARSRIVHPIWEGATGWIGTRRHSPKAKHLAHNPYVSLAYIADLAKPVYVNCTAAWADDLADEQHVWDMFLPAPPPLGSDPASIFQSIDHPNFGLLKLTACLFEFVDLTNHILVWQ